MLRRGVKDDGVFHFHAFRKRFRLRFVSFYNTRGSCNLVPVFFLNCTGTSLDMGNS